MRCDVLSFAAFRVLMAALVPVAGPTAGATVGRRMLVHVASVMQAGGWSVVYPTSTRPSRPARREELPGSRPVVAEPSQERASGAGVLIGYARCSTDKQDLAAQRQTLRGLGVSDDRVYLDHGMTGRNRKRPGLEQALAAAPAPPGLLLQASRSTPRGSTW
jgi:hypothetical protein